MAQDDQCKYKAASILHYFLPTLAIFDLNLTYKAHP